MSNEEKGELDERVDELETKVMRLERTVKSLKEKLATHTHPAPRDNWHTPIVDSIRHPTRPPGISRYQPRG